MQIKGFDVPIQEIQISAYVKYMIANTKNCADKLFIFLQNIKHSDGWWNSTAPEKAGVPSGGPRLTELRRAEHFHANVDMCHHNGVIYHRVKKHAVWERNLVIPLESSKEIVYCEKDAVTARRREEAILREIEKERGPKGFAL